MAGGFVNTSKVISQIERWGEGAKEGMIKHLRREYELIYQKSQVYVPVDTGALKASGEVHGPVVVGDTAGVSVTYGSDEAPYAEIVHERLDLRHAPPTQAKYLERAVQEQIRGMAGRIAANGRREGRARMPATIGGARRV